KAFVPGATAPSSACGIHPKKPALPHRSTSGGRAGSKERLGGALVDSDSARAAGRPCGALETKRLLDRILAGGGDASGGGQFCAAVAARRPCCGGRRASQRIGG